MRFLERRNVRTELPQTHDQGEWENHNIVMIGRADDDGVWQWLAKSTSKRVIKSRLNPPNVDGTLIRGHRALAPECTETVIVCKDPHNIEALVEAITSDLAIRKLWSEPRGILKDSFTAILGIIHDRSKHSYQFVPDGNLLIPPIGAPRIKPNKDYAKTSVERSAG